MNNKDYILQCIGVYNDTNDKIEEIMSNFGVDWDYKELKYEMDSDVFIHSGFGNALIEYLYNKVKHKAIDDVKEKGLDTSKIENLFDDFVNSGDSHFYFNKEEYYTYEELMENVRKFYEPYTETTIIDEDEIDWHEKFGLYALNYDNYNFENTSKIPHNRIKVRIFDDVDNSDEIMNSVIDQLNADNFEQEYWNIYYLLYNSKHELVGYAGYPE